MSESNPYISGIGKIDGYYLDKNINADTAKHSHVYEIEHDVLCSKISVPGYKYLKPALNKDFLIEFRHDTQYYKISYTDLAVDIYQKIRFNPDALKPMAKFIIDIGIQGYETPIPDELINVKNHSPILILIGYIKKHMSGHRLNSLPFGIPISYYPQVLYWLGMNEEINYAPRMSERWVVDELHLKG